MGTTTTFLALLLLAGRPAAQQPAAPPGIEAAGAFEAAGATVREQLEQSLAELAALRETIAAERIPLGRELGELEAELSRARAEHQQATRLLDGRALDLQNLRADVQAREEQSAYLSNLLAEYGRSFEAGLHVAELQRHESALARARLAPEDTGLSPDEVFAAQVGLVELSLERLHEGLGGARFEGTAVGPDGVVERGTFVLIGPAALFLSADGAAGTAEQRLGSLEPARIPFADPADAQAAAALVAQGEGLLPLDPTLGAAHRIEATRESPWEHVQRGGPVMVPILVLAAAALLVGLAKWIALASLPRPSQREVEGLLEAVGRNDVAAARARAAAVRGPVGAMLGAGVEHLGEPRELIEEVMYETVLTTRLRLERMLPFVAISASSAPLLGLLGTVTGIIDTFQLITVFGSGDVKTLSGGISEALITTEYGLIVAIPSLLLHSFLSRKARGIVGRMETTAIAFVNRAATSQVRAAASHASQAAQGSQAPSDGEDLLVPLARPPADVPDSAPAPEPEAVASGGGGGGARRAPRSR